MDEIFLNQEIPIWIILLTILWVIIILGFLEVVLKRSKKERISKDEYPQNEKKRKVYKIQLESVIGFSIFMGVLGFAYDVQASECKTDYIFDIDSLSNTASFAISFTLTFIGILALGWIKSQFQKKQTQELPWKH